MRDDHADSLAALGNVISPELVDASQRLYAPDHPAEIPPGISVTRDHSYGAHARNRLDVFFSPATHDAKPVLVYVHGGGFVRGDKVLAGTPYYDNIGVWAAARGFVGVTMTYRLAPDHRYPAGAEDIAATLAWLHANAATYGGNPNAIVLMGQSAGAAHAAMYAARRDLFAGGSIGVAGIVLMSGIYDFASFETAPNTIAYLDDDPATIARASSVRGLVAAGVPVLFGISELDPPAFHAQAMQLADAFFARDGRFPNVVYLPRHNHISQVAHLGASDVDDVLLSARLEEFIRVATRPARAVVATN